MVAVAWVSFIIYVDSRAPAYDPNPSSSIGSLQKREDVLLRNIRLLSAQLSKQENENTRVSLVSAHQSLGELYAQMFLKLKADYQYRSCLEIALQASKTNPPLLSKTLNTVASWKGQLGKLDQSQEYLAEAMRIDSGKLDLRSVLALARDNDNMGVVFFLKGEATEKAQTRKQLFATARDFFKRSVDILCSRPQLIKDKNGVDLFGIANSNYELASKELGFDD